MRAINFIIGFILLILTTLATNSFATIGEVSITSGSAVIDRQDGDKGIIVDDLLVVDTLAEMFVIGCTVDYVNELGGSYLKVVNPNAKSQCGCGESFGI